MKSLLLSAKPFELWIARQYQFEPNCPLAPVLLFFSFFFLTQKHKGSTAAFILFDYFIYKEIQVSIQQTTLNF
jgi:hypothetical protein